MRSAWYYYTANRAPNAGSASAGPGAALLLAGALLMLTATPAAGQSTRGTTAWSATLTVDAGEEDANSSDDIFGCSDYETDSAQGG